MRALLVLIGFLFFSNTLISNPDTLYAYRLSILKTQVPVKYVNQSKDYINLWLKDKDKLAHALSREIYYAPEISKIFKENQIPQELRSLALALSFIQNDYVSNDGNSGLWNMNFRIASTHDLKINTYVDERRDPYKSTYALVKYLNELYSIYEDWYLVLAAYASSPSDVNIAARKNGMSKNYWALQNDLPENAQSIIPKFIAATYVMNYYKEHGIKPSSAIERVTIDSVSIKKWVHFDQVAEKLGVNIELLRFYNPKFRKDIVPYSPNYYQLALPQSLKSKFALLDELSFKPYAMDFTDTDTEEPRMPIDTIQKNQDSLSAGADTLESKELDEKRFPVFYTVKRGDYLRRIADLNKADIQDIRNWNNLKNDNVYPGQKLIVGYKTGPAKEAPKSPVAPKKSSKVYYTVKSGDTLSEIARKYGVTVKEIKTWNGLKSDQLRVGQKLLIKP